MCTYVFVNRFTTLNEFLTVGYGLKALKATCPGANSELKSCVVRSLLHRASVARESGGALVAEGKLASLMQTPNSLSGG